jgi:glycosyltransferase involved in cell wall biosynthesis
MKVLLSAYACEPHRGSEPGVGWNWAIEIARLGHEVWVITRCNNRGGIESELSAGIPNNLHFIYFDLPRWAMWWKRGPRGVRLYYVLWQWFAYRLAVNIHRREHFDVVHHITFGVFRHPSFMGKLGIPFLFGPLGGGERTPPALRRSLGLRGRILERLRETFDFMTRFDPFLQDTFRRATRIYARTRETAERIPVRYQCKVELRMDAGIGPEIIADCPRQLSTDQRRVIYVGRFLDWKGMSLGLRAFARAAGKDPRLRLTMVGRGPEKSRWKKLCANLGIGDRVQWLEWLPQRELFKVYQQHHLLLFPSFHDAGPNVVLEALAHGLPAICLRLGGPATMVDHTCGVLITATDATEETIVGRLAEAIAEVTNDEGLYAKLSEGALRRAQNASWAARVKGIQVYAEETGLAVEQVTDG